MADLLQVDRSRIVLLPALRGAAGVLVPLAIGLAGGQASAGIAIAVGVLNVALSDEITPYRERLVRLMIAAVAASLSVFTGAATGSNELLTISVLTVWGLAGGMVVALRPAATNIAVPSISLLLIFGGAPAAPDMAAAQAGLVLVGGVVYALVAVAAWPVKPLGPQRGALAALFRRLASMTRPGGIPTQAPLATAEVTTAGAAISRLRSGDDAGSALRAVFHQAERIRLELIALDALRQNAWEAPRVSDAIALLLEMASDVLDALARDFTSAGVVGAIERVEQAVGGLKRAIAEDARFGTAVPHAEALVEQFRTVVEVASAGVPPELSAEGASVARRSLRERLVNSAATVLANVSLHSAAGVFAVRLTVCLLISHVVGQMLTLPRAYWMPMTVAIVMRPDYATTFSRSLGRVSGTLAGLVLATVLASLSGNHAWAQVGLAGALAFAFLSLSAANVTLAATPVSALVVVLLALAGYDADATIFDRGLNTLLGGLLALSASLAWPKWEAGTTRCVLADLLEAYRAYVEAVMVPFLDPTLAQPERVTSTRQAARLARSNAEASVSRLRLESSMHAGTSLQVAEGILANSHRFVRGAIALEAATYHDRDATSPLDLQAFVDEINATLRALVTGLREPGQQCDTLPDLRMQARQLAAASRAASGPLATLLHVTEPMVNSLEAITGLVRQYDDTVFVRSRSRRGLISFGSLPGRVCSDKIDDGHTDMG